MAWSTPPFGHLSYRTWLKISMGTIVGFHDNGRWEKNYTQTSQQKKKHMHGVLEMSLYMGNWVPQFWDGGYKKMDSNGIPGFKFWPIPTCRWQRLEIGRKEWSSSSCGATSAKFTGLGEAKSPQGSGMTLGELAPKNWWDLVRSHVKQSHVGL